MYAHNVALNATHTNEGYMMENEHQKKLAREIKEHRAKWFSRAERNRRAERIARIRENRK